MTRYERRQIGHVIIWSRLVGAVFLALGASFQPHRAPILPACIVLLVILALFYKLTVRINNAILCASFGIGLIRKRVPTAEIAACEPIRIPLVVRLGNSSYAVRLAVQRFRLGCRGNHVAQWPKIRVGDE